MRVFSYLARLAAVIAAAGLFAAAVPASAAEPSRYPKPAEGDYVVKHFTFTSGETLPELRIHYYTLGHPVRDAQGMVRNAVLIGHGTGGSADAFLRPQFAG